VVVVAMVVVPVVAVVRVSIFSLACAEPEYETECTDLCSCV
jgi:hypothetical protein